MDENGEWRLQHGGCAAYRSMGVLLLGPPGAGKSDLLLRLLDRKGWKLVADDQVLLRHHDGALLAQAPRWFDYEFPPEILARTRGGKFSGQTQLWFAFRFTGEDGEIDLAPAGHKPEFDAWRWAPLGETPGLIVPFKRGVYDLVAETFAPFAG